MFWSLILNLAIFDVDGTLTKSSKVDLASFSFLLTKTLGVKDMNTNLAAYEHATASYIYRHHFHKANGRNPRPDEITVAQHQHAALLKHAMSQNPKCVRPIPGAIEALNRLRKNPNWQVALATGAWSPTTKAKLAHAGIDVEDIPAAYADDALSREGIVGKARERAAAAAQLIHFDRVVMIGDGLWDLRTARNLDYGFVGITCESDPATLRHHGARVVLPDYTNADLFMRALEFEGNNVEDTAKVQV